MKFVALVSGGKDSCYNVLHCLRQGHVLAAFANLYPADENQQELDSYMFQTVGHDVVSYYEHCTGVPLFRQQITHGSSRNLDMNYTFTSNDEIEDLYSLLAKVKNAVKDLEAVSVGAILSSYQRTRVEDVCRRLNLTVLSYLWQRDQLELMTEMCSMSKTDDEEDYESSKMDARIIKVAAVGLDQSHLNLSLPQIFPVMNKLNRMYDVHICGEGGEFETMVLDAPFFAKGNLEVVDQLVDSSDASNMVYSVQLRVNFKPKNQICDITKLLENLPVVPLLDDKWMCFYDLMKEFEYPNFASTESFETPRSLLPSPKVSIVRSKDLIYVSNLRGKSTSTSVEKQTRDIFDQLNLIMEEMQVAPSQAISCSLVLNSMSDFFRVNAIYNEFFDISRHGPLPPSRACVESKYLGKHCLVQLSVVFAAIGGVSHSENGTTIYRNKDGLHVQGRSYWAPCNIGPYSQAIWLNTDGNKVSFLSGQIPLVPSSMEMVSKDPTLQGILSLRHFDTLKTTIDAKRQLFMTCFTTADTMVPVISKIWSLYTNEMQYKSEQWMDKEEDPVKCLIIVKVSHLPRDALCEWGGIACQELLVEDSWDDEVSQSLAKPISNINLQPEVSCVSTFTVDVSNKQTQSHFITGFADSFKDVVAYMQSIGSSYKATLYHNPSDIMEIPGIDKALNNIEFFPAEKIFDCEGKPYKFGFHIVR